MILGVEEPTISSCPSLPLAPVPQEYTLKSSVKASTCLEPQLILSILYYAKALTTDGLSLSYVVPCPNAPNIPRPQV